jgi:ATP-dependent RNA helicase
MSALVNDENLVFETSSDVAILPSFDAMGLKEDLLRGVYAYSMSSCVAICTLC